MKKINNYIGLLFLVIFAFSCSEDSPELSTITSTAPVQFNGINDNYTISEGEELVLDYSLGDNQIFDLTVEYDLGGTASEGDDYDVSAHSSDIAALEKAGSLTLASYEDFDTEGDETVTITFTGSRGDGSIISKTTTVTIKDVINQGLVMIFDWDVPFTFAGSNYTTCPYIDLDVYVLDSDGNDLGIYGAATGACPETLIFNADMADGTYYLASNMWENGLAGLSLNLDMPITMTAFKQNVFSVTYTQTDVWTSEDPDQANDGNASFKEVAVVTKSGTTFTVSAPDGTVLGSGAKAPNKLALTK